MFQYSQYSEDACMVYSKLPVYKNKVKKTITNIKEMLKIVDKPYVAFSCGKDSSVLADLVLQIDSEIPLRFISRGETRVIYNVDDVIDYFIKKYNANVEEILFDRIFSEDWKGATFQEQFEAGKNDIRGINNEGYNGVFMGLRKDENRKRKISLTVHNNSELPNLYKYAEREYYRMCPLADWKTEDIGAYLTEHKIPILNWYKNFGFEARTASRINSEALRQNTLFYIKATNPEGYSKLIKRFPELGAMT